MLVGAGFLARVRRPGGLWSPLGCFVGQVVNLRPIAHRPSLSQAQTSQGNQTYFGYTRKSSKYVTESPAVHRPTPPAPENVLSCP